MYFPYVRGKQFDLIAIRELVEDGLLTEKIIPVVEPINLTSTLISTIKTCVDHEKRIAVIHNPQVGVFRSKYSDSNNEELKNEFNELMNDEYELYAHILNEESKSELNDLSDMGIHGSDMLVVHNKLDYIDFYNEYFSEAPLYNLIPDDSAFRRRISKNIVSLKDNFPKKQRNVDYLNVRASIFSDDHLFYETEGYKGFSNCSIIGEDYIDSGFAPRAVAIHIVYFDKDNILKIKHLCQIPIQIYLIPLENFMRLYQN